MKEKVKDGLTTAKEKVGDFLEEYGMGLLTVGLAVGAYGAGLYLGHKVTYVNIGNGLNTIMLKYPDRPIKELKQAGLDILSEIETLYA